MSASVLNKRHNAILYIRVRTDQEEGNIRVGWIPDELNLADLVTKTTMTGNVRNGMVDNIFKNKSGEHLKNKATAFKK